MTLISASPAPNTYIQEYFQCPVFLEPVLKAFINNLLPVFRQLPIIVSYRPLTRIGPINGVYIFGLSGITIHPRTKLRECLHPRFTGWGMVNCLTELFWFW